MEREEILGAIKRLQEEFSGRELSGKVLQIHIGGTQRTGKTTLARTIGEVLRTIPVSPSRSARMRVVEIDIDVTRTTIFKDNEPVIGSELQSWMQICAMNAAIELQVPDIVMAGGIPILIATHSRKTSYPKAKAVSQKLDTRLTFILLKAPSFEEFVKRCATTSDGDKSDMRDPLKNTQALKIYQETVDRFNETYRDFTESHLVIQQGSVIDMARTALKFILSGG